MLIDEVSKQLHSNNLVNFFIFWKNLVKYLVTYVTKRMADAILKTISIKQIIVNFKRHSPIVLLTLKTLYCPQYSADFTYFVPVARKLFYTPGWHFVRMALLQFSLLFPFAYRRKIMVIQRDGTRALERLSNDIELVMLLRFVKTLLIYSFRVLHKHCLLCWGFYSLLCVHYHAADIGHCSFKVHLHFVRSEDYGCEIYCFQSSSECIELVKQ